MYHRTPCTETGIMRIHFRKNTMSSFSGPGRRTTVLLLPPNSLLNYLQGWGLIEFPLRATFPPAHSLASRDVLVAQARAFCFLLCIITPSHPRESPDCPSLHASDEHRSIVRVLRVRRIVWRLPIPPFGDRALRDHRRPSGAILILCWRYRGGYFPV